MKLFKKAKDLFKKMAGQDGGPPSPPPAGTGEPSLLETIFQAPLPEYQQRQRDFERRAKETTTFWCNGTLKVGRNAAKRRNAANRQKLHGLKGGWKKIHRLQGIVLGAA